MKKRFLSILTCVLLIAAMAPAGAAYGAEVGTYSGNDGDVLVAVNTDFSYKKEKSGSFDYTVSPSNVLRSLQSIQSDEIEELKQVSTTEAGVFDRYIDEATGLEMTVLEPNLPKVEPIGKAPNKEDVLLNLQSTQYNVDSVFSLKEDSNGKLISHNMKCLYVGSHCTVWGNTDDDAAIQINSEQAQGIAKKFDDNYVKMTETFGEHYDADNDSKVAIMCYDIDGQYPNSVTEYTAGYFAPMDMAHDEELEGDCVSVINGIGYEPNGPTNGIDCIHIDTYPLMGSLENELGNVEDCYSTLFHEFQHMINFSYQVGGGYESYYEDNQTYMNEAFSMAAEHMICGEESVSDRITQFNNNPDISGKSLTYWRGYLDDYATSYLFGQYLRTQYKLKNGDDGNGFFKALLNEKGSEILTDSETGDEFEVEKSTLDIAAGLLGVTPEKLVISFWKACYMKEATGTWGFAGETWATNIRPYVYNSLDGNTAGINSGGAKYYNLQNGEEITITTADESRLAFRTTAMKDAYVSGMAPLRTSETNLYLNAYVSNPCTLWFDISTTEITDKAQLDWYYGFDGEYYLNDLIDEGCFNATNSGENAVLYYYIQQESGTESEIFSVPIRPYDQDNGNCYATLTKIKDGIVYLDYYGNRPGKMWAAYYDESGKMLGMISSEITAEDIVAAEKDSGGNIFEEIVLPRKTTDYNIFLTDENFAPKIEEFTGQFTA